MPPAAASSQRSPLGLFVTLSVMMFLLFFLWGAWYATMGSFMTAVKMDQWIADAYSVAPIAAIVTPFFMGIFADRFLNAEKLQGILLLLSGLTIVAAPRFATPETSGTYLGLLLAHTLCFMPTLGLSNTICLKHLAHAERDYPVVRVFATLGWIVAGLVVSYVFRAEKSAVQFYVAGAAALAVGIYSFFLPRTPPPAKGKALRWGELIGTDTFPYFKKWAFAVFMVASLLAAMGMMPYWALGSAYGNDLKIERMGGFLTLGQVAELFVLAFALPVFIKRFGIKWTMLVGVLCWVVRYGLFSGAAGAAEGSATMWTMMTLAIVLHGFSYDFVFVSGYLYVDRHVNEDIRAQAQGLLVVFTQGIGFFLSSQIFVGQVLPAVNGSAGGMKAWQTFWLIPAGYLAVVLVLFWLLFREDHGKAPAAR